MGYQSLLFCPDEKTARTVTQVLTELEFEVDACSETFAAVKKLMATHFDAVVVDCENEQNATLLFKSARNSASNQAALAVAVVEGQAGVAKAFRIGANLVLTKPINIEQAKGTLRVARGLLRKGDPGKAASPSSAAVPNTPHEEATPKSVTAAKPPVQPTTPDASKPASATQSRPVMPRPAWPAPAAAAVAAPHPSAPTSAPKHEDVSAISREDSATPLPQPRARVAPPAPATPPAAATKLPTPVAPQKLSPKVPPARPAATHSSGAASAPAPAREVEAPQVKQSPVPQPAAISAPQVEAEAIDAISTTDHSQSHVSENHASENHAAAPSFTFGGANVPEAGNSKKILIAVAALAIVASVGYFGWPYVQEHFASTSKPAASSVQPRPVSAPAAALKPGATATQPISQPAAPASAAPEESNTAPATKSSPAPATTKPSPSAASSPGSSSATSAASSAATAASKNEPAPLVIKSGAAASGRVNASVADVSAPSVIGIGAGSSNELPPNVASTSSAPRPLLQRLNVSQGVSQGLLIKKVQPVYPKNGLSMGLEGAVELSATISKNGDITSIKVLSGDPQLAHAATQAVKQWKYKPYLLNGEPVEIQTPITVKFKLPA